MKLNLLRLLSFQSAGQKVPQQKSVKVGVVNKLKFSTEYLYISMKAVNCSLLFEGRGAEERENPELIFFEIFYHLVKSKCLIAESVNPLYYTGGS